MAPIRLASRPAASQNEPVSPPAPTMRPAPAGSKPQLHAPVVPLPRAQAVTETEVIRETTTEDDHDTDSPWVVLVWNDPINLMSYVVYVFQKLFGYSESKATQLMLDVHHKGRAAVAWGTREQAELDVFRLHEYGLWATMQKDD